MSQPTNPATLVRSLLAGKLPAGFDPATLPPPWSDLARAVLAARGFSARTAAFRSVLANHPDRVVIASAYLASAKPDAPPRDDPVGLVRLGRVQASQVRWLWPGRVPLGKLTILDGDPGLGKSALTLDLAARLSAGRPMPDGLPSDLDGPAGAVLLSAEDGLADTIRPRLEAAGADLDRIVALTSVIGTTDPRRPAFVGRRPPTLVDLEPLERAIAAVQAALVVVDPIMAYLPRAVDATSEVQVRALLARLAALAASEGVAILAVRHLTKAAGRDPLYRGGGSIGIIGAVRSALLVARDPADPTGARRVLAPLKGNLAAPPPSLAYHLEAPAGGALRVVWDGPVALTAETLVDAQRGRDAAPPTALAQACDLLRAILAEGPRPATAVQAEAISAGIRPKTIRRARETLGIRLVKDGYQGPWLWALPGGADTCPPVTTDQSPSSHRPKGDPRASA